MRILIDNRLAAYRSGGIAQYTQQLITALVDQIAYDEQIIVLDHRRSAHVASAPVPRHRAWTPPHNRWEQLVLPLEIVPLRPDVLHFPDFVPLFRLRTPTVITVHDLAFRRFPDILDDAAHRFYGQIEQAVERADAIIAVSHSTRRDLIDLLHVDPARIDVVYEAAAPHFRPLDLPAGAAQTINHQHLQRDRFALFVGTIEPRKNVQTLVHALALLRDQMIDLPPLVVAGADGWLNADLFDLIDRLRLRDAIMFLGAVDQAQLVWLYNACRVYLHPEVYSGFGLPILEAMQCGAPVIAADTSSLPEVVGSAGVLLPAPDAAAWAATWQRVWYDDDGRAQMRQAGYAQAARFSWQQAAEQTLGIYRRLARSIK